MGHVLRTVAASPAVTLGSLRVWASAAVAHRLSCSMACGIFLDQGLNPCPLHWQVDSYPVYHQRSPPLSFCDGLIAVVTVVRELVCNF